MRIACISGSQVPASTAHSIQLMKACHALSELGHTVRLWVPGGETAGWQELAKQYGLSTPFELTYLRSPRFLRRYDFVWRALRQSSAWKADLVYTWIPQAALLALRRGLPAVLELHDVPTGGVAPLAFERILRHPGRKRLLVITKGLLGKLSERFDLDPNAPYLQIAPNGTDLAQYQNLPDPETARRKLNLPDSLTAGYTGHLYAGRGADLLLGLAEQNPQVNFLWVGGRPKDVEAWRQKLAGLDINNVTLTGFVSQQDLPLYQAACDILLMPYERVITGSSGGNSADFCSPMKLFDYLASGRAILSSDLPVLHEVLDENNAIFCEPEDLPAWQLGLWHLASDESLRRKLGTQAAVDAAQYTWRERASRALDGLL